jgi:hypothetical protein
VWFFSGFLKGYVYQALAKVGASDFQVATFASGDLPVRQDDITYLPALEITLEPIGATLVTCNFNFDAVP